MQQLSLSDVEIALTKAREELFAYERRLFCAQSEARQAIVQARAQIAQSLALIVRVDAVISTTCYGRPASSIVRFMQQGVFEPAAVTIMSEAFDMASKELHDTGQPDLVLEVMAGRIARLASTGEFNLLRLRDAALAGLATRPSPQAEKRELSPA